MVARHASDPPSPIDRDGIWTELDRYWDPLMHVDVDGVVLKSHRFAGWRGLGGWLCGLRCSVKFRSRRMPRTLPVLRRSASAQPVAPGRAHESGPSHPYAVFIR